MQKSGGPVYVISAMNDTSSNNPSTSAHHGLTAEAISRRAYELWEKEGRPESRDLHHWLRAEQELLAEQGKGSGQNGGTTQNGSTSSSRASNTDTQPLQTGRAQPAAKTESKASAKRPPTSSATPFDKASSNRSTQPGMRSEPARSSGRS